MSGVATAIVGSAVIGGVVASRNAKKQREAMQGLADQQMESDLFRETEQQKYFQPLQETVERGIGGTPYGEAITDATARKGASLGYNMSGNTLAEIAKSLDLGTNERIRTLTPLAMGRGESQAPTAIAGGVTDAIKQQGAAQGYTLEEIFRIFGNKGTTGQSTTAFPAAQTQTETQGLNQLYL